MSGSARTHRMASRQSGACAGAHMLLVPLACALLLALLFGGLELFVPGGSVLETQPSGGRGYGVSRSVAPMLATGALLVVWGCVAYVRCFDQVIRRYLVAMIALMEAWIVLVACKYCTHVVLFQEYAWYLFYAPLLFCPTLCLFSALRAAEIDGSRRARIVKLSLLAADCLLLAVTLTNHVHFAVFSFDPLQPDWETSYRYGPVYYIVYALMVGQIVAFFAVLMSNSCKRLHSAAVPVAFIGVLGVVYGIAYCLRLSVLVGSNFAMSYIWVLCIALELCFDFGLLPSFAHYGALLKTLPVDLKIYPLGILQGCEPIVETGAASPLSPEGRACVEACAAGGRVRVTSDASPDVVYKAQRVSGGILLVAEDVSDIQLRKQQLLQKQERLERSCELLEQEHAVALQLERQKSEEALLDEVEHSVAQSLSRASELIREAAAPGLSRHAAREKLLLAKMLVSYSKRKSELVLCGDDDGDFERERLQLMISELMADLRTVGVECGCLVQTAPVLRADSVSVLYDCLYDFAIAALFYSEPTLMVHVRSHSDRALELGIALETSEEADLAATEEAGDLRRLLDSKGIVYSLEGGSGVLRLRLLAQREVL